MARGRTGHGRKAVTIGIDIGTSGAKGVLLRRRTGAVIARAGAAYPLLTPRPGWTEQQPEDWWAGHGRRAAASSRRSGRPQTLAAVGLSGQMHGSVFLDDDGEPIRPALLWNDARTTPNATRSTAGSAASG